jgi:hypothetical protein
MNIPITETDENEVTNPSLFTYTEKGHKYTLDGKPMTGVTTVLGVIAKPALIGWAANMAVDYIIEHGDDPESLELARKAHTRKKDDAAGKGKDVHSEVEGVIKKSIERGFVDTDTTLSPSAQNFVTWAQMKSVKFLSSETPVYSKEWFVAGTPDFTCEIDGKRYVGDLKTYKKMWDRVPFFQTAAYMKMLEEMGEPKYDGSVIVNINKETGELTDYYTFDWENDRKAFEACLTLYRQLNNF